MANKVGTMKVERGFTLVELMIVVAIIAIITTIASPSYLEQMRRSNRSDGRAAISDAAQKLERCYTTFGSYDHASCSAATALKASAGITSPERYYRVTVDTATFSASTYALTATAIKSPQTADTGCTALTLSNLNIKGPSNCW